MNFTLPPKVTMEKQEIHGQGVYLFRHSDLGILGRIVLQGLSNGQCKIASEVAGATDDPRTETRQEILRPIVEQISAVLESSFGKSNQDDQPDAPATPRGPTEVVESKLMPCERCGNTAAMLIFATEAKTVADFEDYARKMYAQYSDLNVPTWIIGEPLGDPGFDTCSKILKVWPRRKAIREMTPNDFNEVLDKLLAKHCK